MDKLATFIAAAAVGMITGGMMFAAFVLSSGLICH